MMKNSHTLSASRRLWGLMRQLQRAGLIGFCIQDTIAMSAAVPASGTNSLVKAEVSRKSLTRGSCGNQ